MNALDRALGFHQAALNVRAQRQQVLAANIANADTPYYKARDIDFKTVLGGLQAGFGAGGLGMAATHAGHIQSGSMGTSAFTQYRVSEQGSIDGNTVDMDTERAAFVENSNQYEASLTFINGLIKTMQMAVAGQ